MVIACGLCNVIKVMFLSYNSLVFHFLIMSNKKKKGVEEIDNRIALLGRSKNQLSMGLVGLPNCGKSLTFTVLT